MIAPPTERADLDCGGSDRSAARLHRAERGGTDRASEDPFAGHVFVFRGRRGDLIKLLWWDGDGLCLFAKRLERGTVRVAESGSRHGVTHSGPVIDVAGRD